MMDNSTEREDGDMDVNSPEQGEEMQDVTSPPGKEQSASHMPCQVDKQLDFITFNKDGHFLMGSSNLTGRYWGGSIWYYDDPSLAPSVEKCLTAYEINSGVVDAAFIDEKNLVVGQDSGTVEFFTVSKSASGSQLQSVCQIEEHLDSIHCVKVTCNNKSIITGSADMSIRIWDSHTSIVSRLLSVAHSQQVTGLAPHPSNDQVFLSTGMDGNVLLWDLRLQKPASCVYRDWDDKPECVVWTGTGEAGGEGYLVGVQSGAIVLRNTANLSYNITSFQALNRPLYRLAVNPERPSQVAICGNDCKLVVADVDSESIKARYEDERHNDFIRGLAWKDGNTLFTCGWDKAVHEHTISN
ncbi:methylosome protein 50-like isoform X1 [Penaeus chinensis]|uniref:methylosome protein 50-like isoform X1 n=1 Tax=Penaeus chinensis TaxID=139456 RepID=UPI001FB66972|nr:methylosome protein 50-like isoform X1 [Penaeus chinensis]